MVSCWQLVCLKWIKGQGFWLSLLSIRNQYLAKYNENVAVLSHYLPSLSVFSPLPTGSNL